MKLLLDTHILLWFHIQRNYISDRAWDLILNPQNEVFFSAINIWETQIKHLARPAEMPVSGQVLYDLSIESGLNHLPLKSEHTFCLKELKYSNDAPKPHKDPFDRILICQAKSENMKLLTHDSLIPFYNESCIIQV